MPLPWQSLTASGSDDPPTRRSSAAGTTKLPNVDWGTSLQCPSLLNQQDAQDTSPAQEAGNQHEDLSEDLKKALLLQGQISEPPGQR